MLSLQGDWICFQNRPLVSVNPRKKVLSSGCGQTRVSSVGGEHPFLRDRIRFIQYRPISHWISETAARVVLHGGQQGTILHLSCTQEDCRIHLDGLPWDHNHLVFHIAHKTEEACFGGFDRFHVPSIKEAQAGAFAWQAGSQTIWARAGHLAPLNGYCTSGGFWLKVLSPALTKFRIREGKPDTAGISENTIEVWDASASLHVGLGCGFEAGFHSLAGEGAMFFSAPDRPEIRELPGRPSIWNSSGSPIPFPVMISGGVAACEKKASDLPTEIRRRMLVIEDWQGMKRTLLSATPNCSWKADPEQYHRLADLVSRLQASGHRCGCNVLPFVNLDSEMHREASVRGYCLMARNGHEYEDRVRENPVAWIDLTQPNAVSWMQEQMRLLADTYHFTGFLAAMDEPFPVKAAAASGNVLTLRNDWALRWYDACRLAFEEDSDIVVLTEA